MMAVYSYAYLFTIWTVLCTNNSILKQVECLGKKNNKLMCATQQSVTSKYSSVVCERVEADTSSQDSADCD